VNFIIIITVIVTAWLSIFTFKVGMGYTPLPFGHQLMSRRIYTAISVLFCAFSLYLIALFLPLLQTIFTWLGLISICGLIAVVTSPSPAKKN